MKHFAAALLFMIVVGYVAAVVDYSCFLDGAPQECITALCIHACTSYFQSKIDVCSHNPDDTEKFIKDCQGS